MLLVSDVARLCKLPEFFEFFGRAQKVRDSSSSIGG